MSPELEVAIKFMASIIIIDIFLVVVMAKANIKRGKIGNIIKTVFKTAIVISVLSVIFVIWAI